MNVLSLAWGNNHLEEICKCFEEKGYKLSFFRDIPKNYYYDKLFCEKILAELRKEKIDCVFSLQFFPLVSDFCEQQGMPYIQIPVRYIS